MPDPIKVLIVDDSRIFRSALEQALSGEQDIRVVGSVWNGTKALEFIRATPPDLVTLDVEMPGLNGLDVLNAILALNATRPEQPPVGVIMVSAHTRAGAAVTIQALEAGAFDFVTKPSGGSVEQSLQSLRQQLVIKIRQFMSNRRRPAVKVPLPSPPPAVPRLSRSPRAILIASSTGGPAALKRILPPLCEQITQPILIVQHLPAGHTEFLADSLGRSCRHKVIEARDGDAVQSKTVYIAPGGRHLLVRATTPGTIVTALNEQPPENECRPAADVLFRSAAAVYGGEVIAIVLTGMMCDGTKGLGPLKRAGAYVIAQDEATSTVWGMPGNAVASGNVDAVLPLDAIPEAVANLISSRKPA